MGLKEGEGWRSVGGGDHNLKGALPQWESLPMNNHTDEPRRKRGGRKKLSEKEREMGDEWRRKTNKMRRRKKKKEGCPRNHTSQTFQARRLLSVFPSVITTLLMFLLLFSSVRSSIHNLALENTQPSFSCLFKLVAELFVSAHMQKE